MGKWAWFPLIGSILGTLVLVIGLPSAEGAPQEAVVVTLSAALAIIPYVFARAISEINASQQGRLRRSELARFIAQEMPRSDEGDETEHGNETDSNSPLHVSATIRNPADTSKAWAGDFLIDTNIRDTMVPGDLLEAIGIISAGKREYLLPDGSKDSFDSASILLEVMGKFAATTVLFVSADSEPTIGRISLAAAGLEVDSINKTLREKTSSNSY